MDQTNETTTTETTTTTTSTLPATAEEYEASLKQAVMDKIAAGKSLDNKDMLNLNGFVEMYDPAVGARRQVKATDYYHFLKSMEANQ